MPEDKKRSVPVLGVFVRLMALVCNLLAGLLTGLVVPLAVIAAIVAGVRLATGKVPFLVRVEAGEDGERQLALKLVPPDQVKGLWAEHKQTFGAPLGRLTAEMQAFAEEAKARSR